MVCINADENDYLVTGADNSADIVKILPKEGMQVVQNINTEGQKVYAACVLYGG